VAEKDGKLLVVEVLTGKPSKQVAEAKRKAESVIVLFDVESGENIQVWGRREIKI
jgi:ornithine cyclodeaminase/alanine dehydrogenase-like protein (mu-crystallin family)